MGSRSASACSWKIAPISWSGSVTRRMGRLRSEASPVSTAPTPAPARMPKSKRAVVPEFPQSRMGSSAPEPERTAPSPARPTPRTRVTASGVSDRGGMGTPSNRSTEAVDWQSSPTKRPRISLSPSARAENRSARWLMDLSPGTRTAGSTVIGSPRGPPEPVAFPPPIPGCGP